MNIIHINVFFNTSISNTYVVYNFWLYCKLILFKFKNMTLVFLQGFEYIHMVFFPKDMCILFTYDQLVVVAHHYIIYVT